MLTYPFPTKMSKTSPLWSARQSFASATELPCILLPPILTFPLQGEGIKENFPLAGGKGCTGESDCKTLTGTLLYGL